MNRDRTFREAIAVSPRRRIETLADAKRLLASMSLRTLHARPYWIEAGLAIKAADEGRGTLKKAVRWLRLTGFGR